MTHPQSPSEQNPATPLAAEGVEAEATRLYREAMSHPVGTVAVVEGRTAVLIGKDDGPRRWQWLNGDWTAIPLGEVEAFGHVRDLLTSGRPCRYDHETRVWRDAETGKVVPSEADGAWTTGGLD